MKRAPTIIVTCLYIQVGLLLVLSIIASGYVASVAVGESMQPTMGEANIVVYDHHASINDIEEGDIIAFETQCGNDILHRVTDVTDSGAYTIGDNNLWEDQARDCVDPVTDDNLNGRAIYWVSLPFDLSSWV